MIKRLSTIRQPLLAALLAVATLGMAGCEVAKYVSGYMFKPSPETHPAQVFPEDVVRAQPLDIQLDRDTYELFINNRTPIVYENVEIWLNMEFYRKFDRLEIGPNTSVSLESFINEHGERFPVGSLLEPEKAIPLFKADLIQAENIHALTVRLEEDWQRSIRR